MNRCVLFCVGVFLLFRFSNFFEQIIVYYMKNTIFLLVFELDFVLRYRTTLLPLLNTYKDKKLL